MVSFTPLHPTFGAEVHTIDLATIADDGIAEIKAGIAKVLERFKCLELVLEVHVYNQRLDDDAHVAFSRRFGDLDNIQRFLTTGRKMRYKHIELFDAGNLDADGNILDPDSVRAHQNKGNGLFHVDSSFNPRRASYCFLRAVELPPSSGTATAPNGNTTDLADSRTAFDALPSALQDQLRTHNYVGAHCIAHSRKLGDPGFYTDLDPSSQPHMRHHILQRHEPSSRLNLYVGAHLHYLEGMERAESDALIERLNAHVGSDPFVVSVAWKQPGDIIMWDNRAVLHRAGAGSFEGKYKRDMRRTTVHDDSPTAWGLNATGTAMPGFVYDPSSANNKVGAVVAPSGAADKVSAPVSVHS